MKRVNVVLFGLCLLLMNSCIALKPVAYTAGEKSLEGYKYAYITPGANMTSTINNVYYSDNGNNVYGTTESRVVNPTDIISGLLIKKGYVIVPEISDENKDKTIIVNYGETGRRALFVGYAREITLQIVAAESLEVICTWSAEGKGYTEADIIRTAITRAMDRAFAKE